MSPIQSFIFITVTLIGLTACQESGDGTIVTEMTEYTTDKTDLVTTGGLDTTTDNNVEGSGEAEPTETTAAETTPSIEPATTKSPSSTYKPPEKLSDDAKDNTITVVLNINNLEWDEQDTQDKFLEWFKMTVAELLNGLKKVKRRSTASTRTIKPDDIHFVEAPELNNDGRLLLSYYVTKGGSKSFVPISDHMSIMRELKSKLMNEFKIELVKSKLWNSPVVRESLQDESIFSVHMGLFIVLIIVAVICLVSIVVGIIIIKCRRRHGSYSTDLAKMTLEDGSGAKENPITDEEIMKDESVMVQKGNPNMITNGGGHLNEEEGWVVPLDELNSNEKHLDLEDTKL